ncbi:MAG: zinc ribbon domain-containing protein [Chloroflexi bacterium]|nr:zinc ribbon domain-containing protein [Chloroflexota bacterium]
MQQWYQCPRCGAPVAFGCRFCTNCGTQLNWPTQQQTQPPPVYQQSQQQWNYSYRQPRKEPKKASSSLISCLGLIGIVFLIGGAIFALRGPAPIQPPPVTERQPEYIQQYENRHPPVKIKTALTERQVHLSNNSDAKAVSFAELKTFIRQDDTSEKPYFLMHCVDFAEQLHNNAERAGIKAAFVGVNFVGEEIGHALNAFKTTDRGLVYIDCTGEKLKFTSLTTIEGKKVPLLDKPNPGEWDKVAYIEKGKQYGTINIDKAESLDYGFYVEYAQNCQKMVDDFRNEADAFNRALGGRTTLAEPEYSKFKAWEAELIKKERTLDELGLFEPLGIVETVKIYW